MTDLRDSQSPGPDRPEPPGRPDPDQEPDGRLRRTPGRLLIIAGLVGALIGWSIAAVSGRDGIPVRVPWSGPITLLAAAALLGVLAYGLNQRLQVNRVRIDARRAVAWLALGKAAALLGVLMAGGYAGFAIRFLGDLQTEASRERVIRSVLAIVAGLLITAAGLRIERACMVPPDDNDEDQQSS